MPIDGCIHSLCATSPTDLHLVSKRKRESTNSSYEESEGLKFKQSKTQELSLVILRGLKNQSCMPFLLHPLNLIKNPLFIACFENGVVVVKKVLGGGEYGCVYKGFYAEKNSFSLLKVALKINNRSDQCLHSVQKEANILKLLTKKNSHDKYCLARYLDSGWISSTQFGLVTPLYKKTFREVIKQNYPFGLPLFYTSIIAKKILKVLSLFARNKIIHADLKLDNLLFEGYRKLLLRVIDLGISLDDNDDKTSAGYITTRWYRGPEVVFQAEVDEKLDVWSAGCIFFEIYTGRPLFPASNSIQLAEMIYELLGPAPQSFVEKIPFNLRIFFTPSFTKPGYYDYLSQPNVPKLENRRKFFDRCFSCEKKFKTKPDLDIFQTVEMDLQFKDLISNMIKWDPKERQSGIELRQHPIFDMISSLQASLIVSKF
jgi:serine/threonine protein kinase